MRDYTVLQALKGTAASKIENAFERGYEQGFNDCHSELTEEEAKAHYDEGYKDGYEKGINEVLTIDIFEGIKLAEYNKGYGAGYKDAYEVGKKDGQKAERMLIHEPLKKDLEEAYHKGFKHGQELRAKEAECAEACGMKRAWDVARKILSRHGEGYNATDMEVFGTDDVFSLSASEAVAKLEAWEKKQDVPEDDVKVGDMVRTLKDRDHCYVKVFPIGTVGKVDEIKLTSAYPYRVVANGDYWWYSRDMFEIVKEDSPEMNVDNIEVGDEVWYLNPKFNYVVTNIYDGDVFYITKLGFVGRCEISKLHKTGNHYNIKGILDKMKESEVKE